LDVEGGDSLMLRKFAQGNKIIGVRSNYGFMGSGRDFFFLNHSVEGLDSQFLTIGIKRKDVAQLDSSLFGME